MRGTGASRGFAYCLTALLLTGCAVGLPTHQHAETHGEDTSAPAPMAGSVAEPEPAPAVPAVAPPSDTPGTVAFDLYTGGALHHGTVTLAGDDLVVALDSGQKQTLGTQLGGKPLPDITAVAIPSLALPQGADHVLVTTSNGRNVEAWVLVPDESGFAVAMTAWTDFGVDPVGNLVKVSNRRYKQEGGMFVISALWGYNPETRRYAEAPPLPVPLHMYTVEGLVMLPVGVRPNQPAWIMRTDSPGGRVGVYVVSGNRTLTLLSAVEAGAERVTGVDARDLDGDGIPEYLITGTTGADHHALWVYHWDSATEHFVSQATLTASKELLFSGPPSREVVQSIDTDGHSLQYTWLKDHFVKAP